MNVHGAHFPHGMMKKGGSSGELSTRTGMAGFARMTPHAVWRRLVMLDERKASVEKDGVWSTACTGPIRNPSGGTREGQQVLAGTSYCR